MSLRRLLVLVVGTLLALQGWCPASASQDTSSTSAKKAHGRSAAKARAKKIPANGAKVDINSASKRQLEKLPGVGPATAQRIVAGRPYSSAADLSKAGVPVKTVNALTPMVMVGTARGPVPATSDTTAAEAPAGKATAPPARSKTATAIGSQQGGPGMVWVNPETKVFHRAGDRWYGNTKKGQFMTEGDAKKAGYTASN